MFTNPRRQRNIRKKIALYILLLGALVISILCISAFSTLGKPLYISPVGKADLDIISVEKILKEKNVSFSEVTLSGDSYLVNIQNNGQVLLSQDKNIDKQIASLQRILNQLTIEGKPFKKIDFRFLEPIVSY